MTPDQKFLSSQPIDSTPQGRFICKCACGGNVRGRRDFGHLWTWCDTCTPVVTMPMPRLGGAGPLCGSPACQKRVVVATNQPEPQEGIQ